MFPIFKSDIHIASRLCENIENTKENCKYFIYIFKRYLFINAHNFIKRLSKPLSNP